MMYGRLWPRALVCFLLAWLCVLFYLLGPIMWSNEKEERMTRQLFEANKEVQLLNSKNSELQALLKRVQVSPVAAAAAAAPNVSSLSLSHAVSQAADEPTVQYETYRRRLMRDLRENWQFLSSRFQEMSKNQDPNLLSKTLSETRHRYHTMVSDFDLMTENDGHANWRQKEAKDLSDLVQRRLSALQNPPDCSKARKLVCKLNKGCGYGCQIHHAVYCFIVAYGTERTLILKSKGWRYNKQGGFEEIFQPLSETCMDAQGTGGHQMWPGKNETQVVDIPIVDSINPRPKFLPPAIPADLADRIVKIHGDPIVWWVSEFLRYILRPQPPTAEMLKEIETEQGLQRPLVGVHIRRTDKVGTEAAFHNVNEYMSHVSAFV